MYNLDDIRNPINISGDLPMLGNPVNISGHLPTLNSSININGNLPTLNVTGSVADRPQTSLGSETREPCAEPSSTHKTRPDNGEDRAGSSETQSSTTLQKELLAQQRVVSSDVVSPDKFPIIKSEHHDTIDLLITPPHTCPPPPSMQIGVTNTTSMTTDEVITTANEKHRPSIMTRSFVPQVQSSSNGAVLHGVSDRNAQARVVKHPTPAKMPCYKTHLSRASSGQGNNLFALLQSAMDEKTQIVIDKADELLIGKDEEINNLNEQLEKSHVERSGLKEKVQDLGKRAQTIKKFVNGLSNDMSSLKGLGGQINQAIADAKSFGGHVNQAIAQYKTVDDRRHRRMQKDFAALQSDAIYVVRTLEDEQKRLEKSLGEKAGQLSEAKTITATLQVQLAKPAKDYATLAELLRSHDRRTFERIDALYDLVLDRKIDDERFETIKRCSDMIESVHGQAVTAEGCLEGLKAAVETASSSIEKYLEKTDAGKTEQSDQVAGVENRIAEMLESMKTELRCQEDLVANSASLEATISTLEERLKAVQDKESNLYSRINEYQAGETSLRERIKHLEVSNTSLGLERSSAEQAHLQDVVLSNSALQREISDLKMERTAHTAEVVELQRAKEGLERTLSETRSRLLGVQQMTPDFGPEREKLDAKVSFLHGALSSILLTTVSIVVNFMNSRLRSENSHEITKCDTRESSGRRRLTTNLQRRGLLPHLLR